MRFTLNWNNIKLVTFYEIESNKRVILTRYLSFLTFNCFFIFSLKVQSSCRDGDIDKCILQVFQYSYIK